MSRLLSAGGIFILVAGLGAAFAGSADAKTCWQKIPPINGGGLCVAACQYGCGVHVNNKPGATPNRGCSQYCFDRSGRLIDNVKFDSQGRQIITPVQPVQPKPPKPNPPPTTTITTPPCQPGKSATPFGDNCIKVRPPIAKSGPRSPPPP